YDEQIPAIMSPNQLYESQTTIRNLYLLDYPNNLSEFQHFLKNVTFENLTICFQVTDDAFFHSVPTKEEFKWLYQLIRKRNYFDYKVDAPKLAKYKSWKLDKVKFMFQVFYELNFVMKKDKLIVPTPNPAKQDLESSTLYQEKLKAKDTEELLLYSS